MKIRSLQHIALPVIDLATSCRFYERILKLQPMPRPDFDFPGAWYRIGDNQELHLLARMEEKFPELTKDRHFALEVEDVRAAEKHLDEMEWVQIFTKMLTAL